MITLVLLFLLIIIVLYIVLRVIYFLRDGWVSDRCERCGGYMTDVGLIFRSYVCKKCGKKEREKR